MMLLLLEVGLKIVSAEVCQNLPPPRLVLAADAALIGRSLDDRASLLGWVFLVLDGAGLLPEIGDAAWGWNAGSDGAENQPDLDDLLKPGWVFARTDDMGHRIWPLDAVACWWTDGGFGFRSGSGRCPDLLGCRSGWLPERGLLVTGRPERRPDLMEDVAGADEDGGTSLSLHERHDGHRR
ncbi:hypothetical protein ACLOJK_007074 [Asimina triloba]